MPRLVHDTDSDLAKFSTPADGFGTSGSLASNEVPISVTTLKPSALEKIQEFLIRGERRQACHYALDEKLWAHAMVIASSIDRDTWQEAVKEFIRVELGSKGTQDDNTGPSDSKDRESLRATYSLFAGQGAASGITVASPHTAKNSFLTSVQTILPPAPLSRTVDNKLAPPPPPPLGVTPTSPLFPGSAPTNVPVEVLAKWSETVAMMISNSTSPETSAALTTIGDQLNANQWIEAAHVWYGSASRPHLHYQSSNASFQLPLIPADLPARWAWISHDPFGPCWVSQPGCHPYFLQGSRLYNSFRDCGICLLPFHAAKGTGAIPWTSTSTSVQVDSSPQISRVGTCPARNEVCVFEAWFEHGADPDLGTAMQSQPLSIAPPFTSHLHSLNR